MLTPCLAPIDLVHLCHQEIAKIIKGNDRHFRAFRDGVALWAQRSVPYQLHASTSDDSKMATVPALHFFHRAGPSLNRFHRFYHPCLHHPRSLPRKLRCALPLKLARLLTPVLFHHLIVA